MKFDESRCSNDSRLTSCTRNCDDIALINAIKSTKPYFHQVLSQNFFKCFCNETCATTKRLDMRGNAVYQKIKRLLQDVDIPALLIFLKKHQDIAHVNLANNNISNSGFINLLDHLLHYKYILELDVSNNDIMEIGIKYLLAIGENIQLKSLNLKANKFGVEASKNIALFLLKNKYVTYLNVAEVGQTASSLIYFIMVLSSEQTTSNTTLKSLDISRPNPGFMYYFDSVHFSSVIGHMLKNNTTLTALYLQKYNFNCHDIETLMSNAIYNNTLHLLDLGCNNVGDHGIIYLANWLTKRPALKILILCRNIITDHGAREFSFALPFSKLLSLDISYNKITDNGMVDILNTLKKSPLLRQLRIFGNCLGHPTAKIIKRMLLSQVLNQENVDIRPYRVDHRWYLARYEGDCCRKEFYNVPYGLSMKLSSVPVTKPRPKRSYYKQMSVKTSELKVQHSTITIISNILKGDHARDCKCCYCFKCEAPHYDELCRDAGHPETCTCCKCKENESSDWSIDTSIEDRVVSPRDPMKNIMYILRQVNSDTREDIVRWININEDILEEDLKIIAIDEIEECSSKDLCNCSWAQLSISSLQKYLLEDSSKDILIIPRNNSMLIKNACDDVDDTTSSLE
ncbi:leucine-rich repeat-containing protein 34-like [Colletes gigas]|uniref:leucine-rich repeat-containing protein 34-like n=1 Tax=Colletes gigas TaxID=935657 RepID=UPI001C9B789E|nr:leucine-rich repeat-containing protein 34-like [Colletes gigas]